MKMGEVVEDANISQQHLQVASTVVVDDEDEDDAENVREKEKEYSESLANLSLRPLDYTETNDKESSSDGDNNTNTTAKNNSKGLSSKYAICPFTHLLPKHLERKRRILNKKYLQALKRVSEKGGPQLPQLKAKKEYELRFLEATYIRNVLYQSLPRLPTTSTSTTTTASCLVNNVSGDRSSRVSSDNNTNHNRLHNDSEGRTFANNDDNIDDDPESKNAAVPRPSAISDKKPNSGVWLNCLKSKAMNDREPNHLIQVAYDNYVLNEGKRLWLSKQSKKKRSPPSVSEKATGAASVTSSKLDNNCIDDKKSSPTRNSSKLLNDSRTTTTAAPAPPPPELLSLSVESPNSKAVPQQKEKFQPIAINVSQMRPRSLEGKEKESQDQTLSTTKEDTNSNSATVAVEISAVEETRSSTPIAASVSKEEFDKGRKTALSYLSAALKNSSKGVEVGKATSATSLSSSDSSLKTAIVENTDSSSSSTCTSASSNSFSDNASILRGPNDTPSPPNSGAPATPTSGSNKSNLSSSDTNTSVSTVSSNHGSSKSNKKLTPGPKAPKKYSEKMKAEASVLQRISELQKEGMWWERRLPKVYEPPKTKSHWDYLLEEMTWLSADFVHERKWKRSAAKRCAKMIEKHFHDKELKRQKAEKDEEARKKRTAAAIAKLIKTFWSNVQTVVEFKEQTIIDSMRKKALDQKLSYLVNETEKYSEIVAQTFTAIAKKTGIGENGDDSKPPSDTSSVGSSPSKTLPSTPVIKEEVASPLPMDEDAEFVPPSDSESDVDDTIAEEEAKEKVETPDHKNELDDLEAENNMSYEELLAKYAKYLQQPEAYKEPVEVVEPEPKPKPEPPQERRMTRGRMLSGGRQLRTSRRLEPPPKVVESDIETDVDDDSGSSSTEEESQDEEDNSETDKANDDLASLLKSISSDGDQKRTTEEETNKLADLAESFKPTGYTLSSTTVVTKVPHLLRHTLREYQHIGLDWLVTMYDKKLNGILADEMGLGKTIQTIALLAYLAVERCNWGPHLIIVPTSVMLNWEMEFKKWCPGFKILTYYGSQKERKLKRSGWTKPNAFHVCITSYKLVIQDHQSFRRKRWKYLILDEAQNIKNFKSQRWQLLLNFHTQRRLLLTGTPLQNNLMELWSLLHFLMPNVFQSHMEFKDWFSNPMSGMVEGSQEYNEDIVRRLHKVLRPFILRRMKSEVEKQLPQKYEHVVMCSLSKRQRYLYEEFMSRSRTRETLNQGNLLSVINILMQLRKVCNHPNLFEPRPIVSPLHTDGIFYGVQFHPLVWDIVKEREDDPFRHYFPVFTVSNTKFSYSDYDAQRISELTPLFAYNPDEERRYVIMNYEQCGDNNQPPAKRVKRIVNLVKSEPPPCPRLQKPLTFFMSVGPPNEEVLQDKDFMDHLKRDAAKKLSSTSDKDDKTPLKTQDTNKINLKPTTTEVGAGTRSIEPIVLELSDSENDGSSSDSDFEIVKIIRKRKTPVARFDITQRLNVMGCTVPDFELDYIQERILQDRKLVVNNLNKVNWSRCRVHTYANSRLRENCQIVGSLPPLRLTSRRTGCFRVSLLNRERPRDFEQNGYFKLGFNEIMKIVRIRQEDPNLMHHPLIMWSTTKHLDSMISTLQGKIDEHMSVLTRFVMYIPAVSAPLTPTLIYRPPSSRQVYSHYYCVDEYKKQFFRCDDVVHPMKSRMMTQFPDPRLIQYDCGKLQTLDLLLRRLKSGSHRVLIFTQMAKVLDILEAFLNYHGHTYLRLDGATKIDQRQLLMERFNADKKIFCFILSTRSGGIGVNLTGADTVIFYDSDWNPTMDAQAQDRCHRIGQTRDVHIYRLVSEKTVEENILKKSNQKRLLGELAIEGGKFTTTYFKQNTIRELFTINEKDDVTKRLTAWNTDPSSSASLPNNEDEEDTTFDPTDLMRSPEKKHEMQMIECALAAAEDDTDVQAAQTVHAEAEAEMAEFDENVSLDALDDGKAGPNKFEIEFQQVYEQLTDIERYAMRLMESTIDDWSKETVAQAQKDLEEQKIAWELQQQQKNVQEHKMEIDDDSCTTEDYLSYVPPLNSHDQVWVAQFGSIEQEMVFPLYEPPTPPYDDMDIMLLMAEKPNGTKYMKSIAEIQGMDSMNGFGIRDEYRDTAHGYLYDYDIMMEDHLPPVYVPKYPKKPSTPVSPIAKPSGIEKTPEPVKEVTPDVVELDTDSPPTKKSPKIGRREDPIFAPKSLFDRPAPALAKLRRDYRAQRYSCRPVSQIPKTTLGPGSITFPIVAPGAQKAPPPPAPADSPDWLIAEDHSLVQTVRNVLELPTNLLVLNLAQTPNWDYAHETVNSVGLAYRTPKQCKWRYENVVAPREEGKIILDSTSSSDPTSPSAVKKKKAKTFIKIAPPSPSKTARVVKVSQMLSQDNNAQYRNIFSSKFDTIKTIANKRAPTTKPATVGPQVKTNKHIQVITELGINYDQPLAATSIAQARYDRIQMERKKIEMVRQQQAAVVAATAASGAPVMPPQSVPTTIIASVQTPTMGTALASTSTSTTTNVTASQSKPKVQFGPAPVGGGMPPVIVTHQGPDGIQREYSLPQLVAQHQSRMKELSPQQQQYIYQQQKAIMTQAQAYLQSHGIQPQLPAGMVQNSNVNVLTSAPVGTTQTQQTVRPTTATIQVQQTTQQTVVLASGLAQALASGATPLNVNTSTVSSPTLLTAPPSSTPTMSTVARHLQPSATIQPQLQRVPTITMQDLVSSAANTQKIQTGIISTSAPAVLPSVSQTMQSQPTLVSLTPMSGPNSQQLSTKLLQNPQGIATLVQSTPSRTGSPTISQQTGNKVGPLQLQYLRQSGLIRQNTTMSSTVTQQQPQQQQQQQQPFKEQLMSASQMRKLLLSAQQPAMVSTSNVTSQHNTVTLPPVSTIPAPNAYSIPSTAATSSPMVTLNSTTSSKVALSQSNVTMAISSPNVSPITASAVVHQQTASRHVQRRVILTHRPLSGYYGIPMSTSTDDDGQLVKQHTVGGKTVTRPVTDAEVAAFLKHHGIPAITNTVNPQSVLPGSKTPVATFQGSVPVQGSPALLTVGLQNLMKMQQTSQGQVATLVKAPVAQVNQQPAPGGTLAFPVHLSKLNTKGATASSGVSIAKQQVQTVGVQQLMLQRRQQQDQTPQSIAQQQLPPQQGIQALAPGTPVSVSQAGKMTHLSTQQVSGPGSMPTHVVVQTTQKQLQNTIAVQQLQQVFKQVGATGQVISQSGQVLQAQMIGKPIAPSTITVTSSGATSAPTLTIPSSSNQGASFVQIPNIVQGASSSGPIHARIVPVSVNLASQQPGGVKQTIQVVSGPPPPNATLIGTGPINVRPPPPVSGSNVQPVNSIQIKLPTSTNNPPQSQDDNN